MVKVTAHPTTGLIVTPSTKNPLWGTFRVDSSHTSMENGILNTNNRTAFIRGEIASLEAINLKAGQILPGKIVKRESFQPFFEGQQPKINPKTGAQVLVNGLPSFIEFVYTEDTNAVDVWIGENPNAVSAQAQEQLANQAV